MFFMAASLMSRAEMSDVPKVLLYRPEFLGAPLLDLSVRMMRGPSFWTVPERECMAVTTAQVHKSDFCLETHTEMVRLASDGELDPADRASLRPELAAVLPLLEGVSQAPYKITAADLQAVRGAGVSDAAITDALHVNLIWNIVDRLSLAFDFQLRQGQLVAGTRSLHRFGYQFPGFLTGGRRGDDQDGHSLLVDRLRHAVFETAARTDPKLRTAAASGAGLPEPWASYTEKVRDRPYQVTDADIHDLTAAGHSEDEIFELTVAAATGAALRSLDSGLRALPHE